MPAESQQREQMVVLCARALKAELNFDELVAAFPNGEPDDEYLAIAYEDLVDGVEHLPATFSGKTDITAWENSEMFAALSLHLLLLTESEDTSELLHFYHYVSGHRPLAVDALPQLVAQARKMTVAD